MSGFFEGMRDAFESFLKNQGQSNQDTWGGFIQESLAQLNDLITRTPFPKEKGTEAIPKVFGAPPDGTTWGPLYDIYINQAQPYAYVILFMAVVGIQFLSIFDNFSDTTTGETKSRLVLSFILITTWWPIAVLLLSFADSLSVVLLDIGTPDKVTQANRDNAGVGLEQTYAVVKNNLTQELGIAGLILVNISMLAYLLVVLALAALWFVRHALIFILMPVMPLMFALWALDFPGFDPLSSAGQQVANYFVLLSLVTIPGALIVGLVGRLITLAATAGDNTLGATVPGEASVREPAESVTGGVNPEAGAQASPGVEPAVTETTAQAAAGGASGAAEAVLLLWVMIGTTITAALGPFILAKVGDGTGVGFLDEGPSMVAGAAVGAATGGASAVSSFASGYRGDDEDDDGRPNAHGDDADADADADGDADANQEADQRSTWSTLGRGTAAAVGGMKTAGSAAARGGKAVASKAPSAARTGASAAKSGGKKAASKAKRGAAKAHGVYSDTVRNPELMREVVKQNMKNKAAGAYKGAVDQKDSAVETAVNAKHSTKNSAKSAASATNQAVGDNVEAFQEKVEEQAQRYTKARDNSRERYNNAGQKTRNDIQEQYAADPDYSSGVENVLRGDFELD
jgi:hypothetical protein